MKKQIVLYLLSMILLTVGCARSSISERDSRREQIRVNAELKRKELQKVAGDYAGTLRNPDGKDRATVIHIEVKDIPHSVEGEVDPIMIPALSGYLRFPLDQTPGSSEYIGYSLESSEYDNNTAQLNLVFNNKQFGNLIIDFLVEEENGTLSGSWSAPKNFTSGTIEMGPASEEEPIDPEEPTVTLTGDYSGYLFRSGDKTYHRSTLTLRTHLDPETGLQVSGSLRVYFNKSQNEKYLTFQFEKVSFNPTQGQLILTAPEGNLLVKCEIEGTEIMGEWSSDNIGRMGTLEFSKQGIPKLPSDVDEFYPLNGTYEGRLINTHEETSLDGPFKLNISVTQDLSKPTGVSLSGEMLIYLDITGTYDRIPIHSVDYDFFTGKTSIRTIEKYKTTLDLTLKNNRLTGDFIWDSHGKVAEVEVSK